MHATQELRTERQNDYPSIGIASHASDVKSSLRLVYDAYVRAGLIEPHGYEIRVTPYHLLSTTEVYLAEHDGEVACTVSLIRDGALGLPIESIFPEEVNSRRERGVACAESSCLADRRSEHERSFPLLAKLMGFTIQCAAYRGVDEMLIAVHPRHARFYQKYLGFDLINAEERSYEAVRDNPAVALSLNIARLQMSATPAHRRVFGHDFSSDQLRRRTLSAELLTELSYVVDETYENEASTLVRQDTDGFVHWGPDTIPFNSFA